MRSAVYTKWSEWELRKAAPPMTLSIGMPLLRSPSSQSSYLLGTWLRLLSLRQRRASISSLLSSKMRKAWRFAEALMRFRVART